jgi:selenium metabolism protein YedF
VAGGLAVVVSRDTMGEGAEELGKILIKGFIYSLSELPTPPSCVIFLNSGARLTTEGANTVEDLKKLGEKGAEVLTCGTCVNYYGLQGKLAVGAITDMYGITERIAAAAKVMNI